MLLGNRRRGSGHKLNYWKFHLNIRWFFFYCEGGQTLEWAAQRGCAVSVLRDTQNLTGHDSEQPALDDPALSRGVELDELQECLPASPILSFSANFPQFWENTLGLLPSLI